GRARRCVGRRPARGGPLGRSRDQGGSAGYLVRNSRAKCFENSSVDAARSLGTLDNVRFSLQVQYAICGVFDLAYNGHGEPVQIRVISERQGIPARYLEQIFGRLRRGDLVASKRGPGGGYTLARTAAQITLREVLEAVEGPLEESVAMEDGSAARKHRPDFLWPALAARIGQALDGTTIEQLCTQAARAGLPRAQAAAPMDL